MSNLRRIEKRIQNKYRQPNENIYSNRLYHELFMNYSCSLSDKSDRHDFYRILSDDTEISKLFWSDFSNRLEQIINEVLYSLATYGLAYICIKPDYINVDTNDGKTHKVLQTLHINEAKGILKNNIFYYKNYNNEIVEYDTRAGSLIVFDIKELGFRRNYFVKLNKKLSKYDITSTSTKLIYEESAYDFSVHSHKCQRRILKAVANSGWMPISDGLSDSYILYKVIKTKMFKMKCLNYVLNKVNNVLRDKYIRDESFKIEASTKNVDYEEIWKKYQCGDVTLSELSKIVW